MNSFMCYPWCYPKNVTRACGACLCVEDLVESVLRNVRILYFCGEVFLLKVKVGSIKRCDIFCGEQVHFCWNEFNLLKESLDPNHCKKKLCVVCQVPNPSIKKHSTTLVLK